MVNFFSGFNRLANRMLNLSSRHTSMPLFIALLFIVLGSSHVYAANLTAEVDRNKISEEETFNLSVRIDEQVAFGKPDFTGLKNNFDILSNNQSNQYRSINGQVESWTQWRLMLAPKRTGKLIIPALSFKGASSKAITIDVSSASSNTSVNGQASDKPVYIETSVDKKQLFVQEQLLLTVRLITSVNLQGLNSDELKIPDAVVKQVGESQYQRRINGRNHLVVESIYAIFPQSSGELTIPRLNWTITLEDMRQDPFGRDPFFNRGGKRLRLHSDEKIIPVMPQPGNYPSATWLPASDLNISQSWSSPTDQFTVGEPITRTITLQAKGLSGAQLPPLQISEQRGVKYYPDQPQSEDSVANDGVTGTRTESYAIVPTKAGSFTLPSVVVTWWDTKAKRIREVSLPVEKILVAPALGSNGEPLPTVSDTEETMATETQPPPSSDSVNSFWKLIGIASLVANVMLLVFIAKLWRRRSQQDSKSGSEPSLVSQNEKQAFNRLKAAAKSHQPQQTRQALIRWAQQYWHEPQLNSLNQIVGLSQSNSLQAAIAELDAILYQADSVQPWNADSLIQAVELERKQKPGKAQTKDEVLPELYP
jgi:oxygen tolerance protein BatD